MKRNEKNLSPESAQEPPDIPTKTYPRKRPMDKGQPTDPTSLPDPHQVEQDTPEELPQGGLMSRKRRFKSYNDLLKAKKAGGLVVPKPGSLLAKLQQAPRNTSSDELTDGQGLRGRKLERDPDEANYELRKSPARSQLPAKSRMEDKPRPPWRTGIHTLKVARVDSSLEGEKALGRKQAKLHLGPGPAPKPAAQPTPIEEPAEPIQATRIHQPNIWERFKSILTKDELPKSTYLLAETAEANKAAQKSVVKPIELPKPELEPEPQQQEMFKGRPLVKVRPKQKFKGQPSDQPSEPKRRKPPTTKGTASRTVTYIDPEPQISWRLQQRLIRKLERIRRERNLKRLHSRYAWRRAYTAVKADIKRKKAEEAEIRLREQRVAEVVKRRHSKKRKPKKTWFVRLLEFFDEDEGEFNSDESLDEEDEILRRLSFQQQTLGERRAEFRGAVGRGSLATGSLETGRRKSRLGSDLIRQQQIGAASRRIRNGSTLGMNIAQEDHPLTTQNIENSTDYEDFAKRVRTSLPSTYAVPHTDAAMNLFDKLVPLLKVGGPVSEFDDAAHDRLVAAQEALDEFRVTKRMDREEDEKHKKLADIRYLPGNLEQRRVVLSKWETSRAHGLTCRKSVKHFFKDLITTIRSRSGEIFKLTEIWHDPVRQIEMNFGVSAATYFRWLRSVVLLNCLYSVFSFTFLIIPEIMMKGQGQETLRNFTTQNVFVVAIYRENVQYSHGWFAFTPYNPESSVISNTGIRFIIVVVSITVLDSIFIGAKLRTYYTRVAAKISDTDKTGGINFFAMFLSAWDYNLTSETAVKVQRRTIARNFNKTMDLYEAQLKLKAEHDHNDHEDSSMLMPRRVYRQIIRRWVVNLCFLAFACLFGFSVYLALNSPTHREFGQQRDSIAAEISTSIGISVFLNLLSPVCSWITSFETFATTKEKVTVLVFRFGLFYISTLTSLYVGWLGNSRHFLANQQHLCWEDEIGTEIYRLIIFEGVTDVVMTSITYIVAPAIKAYKKWMKQKFEKTFFNVEYFTLNLIYIHTLSGIGAFFFPLLPLVVVARLVFLFYWTKFLITHFCAYPLYQLHPSEIFAPYVASFFFSFLAVVVSNSWLISEEAPSSACGPFTGYANATYGFVFEDVVHSSFGVLAQYIASPWFLYCIVIILCSVVYTFRAWTSAYQETANLLHKLLQLERLDRELLLKAMYAIPGVSRASEGQGSPSVPTNSSTSDQASRVLQRPMSDIRRVSMQQEVLAKLVDQSEDDDGGRRASIVDEAAKPLTATEIADQARVARRYKQLLLSSKALRLWTREPRRLSKAAEEYAEVIDKVISTHEAMKKS